MKKIIVLMCLLGLLLGCTGQQVKDDVKDPNGITWNTFEEAGSWIETWMLLEDLGVP